MNVNFYYIKRILIAKYFTIKGLIDRLHCHSPTSYVAHCVYRLAHRCMLTDVDRQSNVHRPSNVVDQIQPTN